MSKVKWIKLSTSMFDDEKIKLIEQMPDADTILVIWVKLLAQAGKTNSSGYIFLSENIPYTDEMLATIFDRPLSTVRLAIKTFEDMGMIGIDDNSFISIENWDKHQSVDRLAEIREQNRERQAKFRDKKKLEQPNKDSNVDVTLRNGTEVEEEVEEDKDKEKDRFSKIKDLLSFFSSINNFNELNKKYWDVIRETRKTGKISESVIYNNMIKWKKYDLEVVEHALKSHINNHTGKKEEYTIGIMRNTKKEDINKKDKVRKVARF